MDKFYTGVGSRDTPDPVAEKMEKIAVLLYNAEYILRSGGALGADTAFERGVNFATKGIDSGKWKRIYVPWKGFRASFGQDDIHEIHKDAFRIASRIHLVWNRLSDAEKRLHARNVHQVLGDNLMTPSKFLVCWTLDGLSQGGTRTAIMLAKEVKIPVYNLGSSKYKYLTPDQVVDMIFQEEKG
jgi:hypothetical protein